MGFKMAKQVQAGKVKIQPIKLPEPQRRPGRAWTAIALVFAVGSGALNVTGWALGVDSASRISIAFGATLCAVSVGSELAQLFAVHNAELAWKTRPYRQSAKWFTLLAIAAACGVWNGYSAHRAVDMLNAGKAEAVWADYMANKPALPALDEAVANNLLAQVSVVESAAPAWSQYQTLLERIKSAPPEQMTVKTQAMADKALADIKAWVSTERARLRDDGVRLADLAKAERERVEALASAGTVGAEFQLGLSVGLELIKMTMIWAGAVVTPRRKRQKVRAPIQWGNYFVPVRKALGSAGNVISFRRWRERREDAKPVKLKKYY